MQAGVENRKAAVAQAEAIIESSVDSFMQWLAGRQAVPAIKALHTRAEALKQAELERARRMLANGHDAAEVLESLAHALTGKFLHGPTSLLSRPGEHREHMARVVDHLLPHKLADLAGPEVEAATVQGRRAAR